METEDTMSHWMNEKADISNNHFTLVADLYADWKAWCEVNGEFIGSTKAFSQALEERGLKRQREPHTGKRGFAGIAIRKETLV